MPRKVDARLNPVFEMLLCQVCCSSRDQRQIRAGSADWQSCEMCAHQVIADTQHHGKGMRGSGMAMQLRRDHFGRGFRFAFAIAFSVS